MSPGGRAPCKARRSGYDGLAYKWVVLSNTTIGMLLATINSSIILIALDIFRRIHLDPLTPANTNVLRTTACLLVGWASVLALEEGSPPFAPGEH
jgi:hypothetical protein